MKEEEMRDRCLWRKGRSKAKAAKYSNSGMDAPFVNQDLNQLAEDNSCQEFLLPSNVPTLKLSHHFEWILQCLIHSLAALPPTHIVP
jgi:hypothetical protein